MVKQLIDIQDEKTNTNINILKFSRGFNKKTDAILFVLSDYWNTENGKKILKEIQTFNKK